MSEAEIAEIKNRLESDSAFVAMLALTHGMTEEQIFARAASLMSGEQQ